jgi:hypothetical protein
MAIKIVRPMDPVYLDSVGTNLSPQDKAELKAAIAKYNKACDDAAVELNNYCTNKFHLPPEETVHMKK